jgi:glycosyltransferase involved in cell wall biosynthesis
VAIPDSVHTARWLSLVSGQGWDIHLFSVRDKVAHPDFKNVTIYGLSSYRPKGMDRSVRLRGIWPLLRGLYSLDWLAERFSPVLPARSTSLAWIIRWLKPDIVHSLEFQHAGYLTLEAKLKLKNWFPTWVVTNWGSDIYLFGRLSEHVEKIKSVLSACDYYACECQRDVELARAFGFKGEIFAVLPIAGGYDIARARQLRQPGSTSARRLIALKGYQGWAGRALVGLRAIELSADLLKGYRVAIYLASPEIKIAAELVAHSTGIPIEIVPPSPHEDILRLHGRARVSIGLSISDAASTSLLEAMVMGSFPIQSDTSCADEWVQNGETGLLVHPEDPEAVAAAIRRAVTDDDLVDRAAEPNARVAAERLERSVIQPQVIAMYEKVAAQAVARKRSN